MPNNGPTFYQSLGGAGGVTIPTGVTVGGTGATIAATAFNNLSPMTANNDMIYYAGGATRLPIGASGQVLSVSASLIPSWAAAGTASPLTTKGDLYGYSTVNARFPVGADRKSVRANSNLALGIEWAPQNPINYILNSDAIVDTTGWNLYKDAAGARPVDGTGNGLSAVITWTRSTTTPLRGAGMFIFTKTSGASRQGEGVSYDFTIDIADQARMMTIEFDTILVSGTYAVGTSTTDSDLIFYIYDVTNGVMIEPSNFKIQNNSTTVSAKYSAQFQTSSNSTSYRLIYHVAVATDSANVMGFDNVKVGPSPLVMGVPSSDWTAYTPTISSLSGTLTNYTATGFWRRIGDTIECKAAIAFTGAAGTWSGPLFSLPTGRVIDTAKLAAGTIQEQNLGESSVLDSGVSDYTIGKVEYNNTTSVLAKLFDTSKVATAITQAAPFGFASGDQIFAKFSVPIVGWSSNVQMSDQNDQRVVAASYNLSTNTTANNAVLKFDQKIFDSHSAYSPATGLYTIPSSGRYRATLTAVGVSGTVATAYIRKNGVSLVRSYPSANNVSFSSAASSEFVAGDTIDFFNSVNTTFGGGATDTVMTIEKIQGPSAIGATEVVSASYTDTSGLAMNNTAPILKFPTKKHDTHEAYNTSTGVYTVPVSGKYVVTTQLRTASTAFTAADTMSTLIYVDGALDSVSGSAIVPLTSTTDYRMSGTSRIMSLVAGQQVTVIGYSGRTTTLTTAAGENNFSIQRIGL